MTPTTFQGTPLPYLKDNLFKRRRNPGSSLLGKTKETLLRPLWNHIKTFWDRIEIPSKLWKGYHYLDKGSISLKQPSNRIRTPSTRMGIPIVSSLKRLFSTPWKKEETLKLFFYKLFKQFLSCIESLLKRKLQEWGSLQAQKKLDCPKVASARVRRPTESNTKKKVSC